MNNSHSSKTQETETTLLNPINIPEHVNYIGVFLTLGCNLNCSYCINDPIQEGKRNERFDFKVSPHLTAEEWARGLERLNGGSVPLTLQGGEPTLYFGSGKEGGNFYDLIQEYTGTRPMDLLTNLQFDPEKFIRKLGGNHYKLVRDAPYPSIRVSYHHDEMEKKSGGIGRLVDKVLQLGELGLKVSSEKSQSDVGIYMVEHPENLPWCHRARDICKVEGVVFEGKPFLGIDGSGVLHGKYLYPFSTILEGTQTLDCSCRTTEVLVAPSGFIYRCHHDLYESEQKGRLVLMDRFEMGMDFQEYLNKHISRFQYPPTGHILARDIDLSHSFRSCSAYGNCIGCDTKVKNDRFQSLEDDGVAHTSVEIRGVELPPALKAFTEQSWLDQRQSLN